MGSFKRKDAFQCFLNAATKSANCPVVLKAKPALWLPKWRIVSKPKLERREIPTLESISFGLFFRYICRHSTPEALLVSGA